MASSSSSPLLSRQEKQGLGWMEWLKGWSYLIYEVLFQKITARHLQNPLPLPSLESVTCIVTGSTSGIGLEMARQLAESGAHVVMAVRNPTAAHDLIQEWQNDRSKTCLLSIEVMELNLLSLDSVVRFSKAWNSRLKPLHVLINNAGIFSIGQPQNFSKDGYEEHIQVNHLAPALLSILLLPSLLRGSPSRIVNVNSSMHFVGSVDVDDMNFVSGKNKFTSLKGYSSSKLAQIMFSSILQKCLPIEAGISVVCVSPGSVRTNVARDLPKIVQVAYHVIPIFLFIAQEGSRSALFAATDPQILEYCMALKADEWPVCAYISHSCRPMNASTEAHKIQTAHKVWEKTLDMIGLPSDAMEKILEGKEVQCKYEAH
ncbi:hypothetical protein L1049_003850 [Liquidambar formosana]|uniref:Uncharacterized protein n=1 Tax=Liquidambar formosana TaxID=63359 RepID=A0AAP0WV62_LIQFO